MYCVSSMYEVTNNVPYGHVLSQVVGPDQMWHVYWQPLPTYIPKPTFLVKQEIPSPEIELELMSVEQVCNWIRELGICKGWYTADINANVESFRLWEIDGRQLVNLTIEDLHDMKIVWKLGHKIEITRAVQKLIKSSVNVIEKYFSAMDLEGGKQVSSSEERATSEPPPVGSRQFERGKVGVHKKKRCKRPTEANGYKPEGGLKHSENKEVELRSRSESDQSSMSQKSMPITCGAETRGISSGYKISTSTSNTLKEGENLDLSIISKSDEQEAQNAGGCEFEDLVKVRASWVHDALKDEPKKIIELSDSDEADKDPYIAAALTETGCE